MSQALLLINPTRTDDVEGRRRNQHLRELKGSGHGVAAVRREIEFTVRALHGEDAAAIDRLAGRDSASLPEGDALGAEINGELVAAISLVDGSVIADPFRPTTSAIELLRLRARQLGVTGERRRRPSRGWRRLPPPRALVLLEGGHRQAG